MVGSRTAQSSGAGFGPDIQRSGRKGITLLALAFLLPSLLVLFFDAERFLLLLAFYLVLSMGYYGYAIADAIANARRLRSEYVPKHYNRTIVYIGIFAVVTVASGTIFGGLMPAYMQDNYMVAFRIPSASMQPTILIGDHVLVDRRPSAKTPNSGDLIVYEEPANKKAFIKRVVAVGGETVSMKDKVLLIDGEPRTEPYAIHSDSRILPGDRSPRDNFGPITVPEGSCFVMGDNRDESYDSRFTGCVEQAVVMGTARSIYWSWDKEKGAVRWNRIGTGIR